MLVGVAAAVPSGAVAATKKLAPFVSVSVATKDGTLIGPVAVRPEQTRVKVGGKRCTVAAGTPLAALVALKAEVKRSPKVGTIALKDYGACGKRPSDSARLYLTGIGKDVASGPDGWIYDVNGKGGSTSAADPKGPFAHGRLKKNATVSWRWCRISEDPEGDCGDVFVIGKVRIEAIPNPAPTPDLQADSPLPGVPMLTVARYHVPVLLRRGANGDTDGTTAPAPVGTVVELIAPTGVRIATGKVGSDGEAVLDSDAETDPPDSRLVVRGVAAVAPAGKVLAFPES